MGEVDVTSRHLLAWRVPPRSTRVYRVPGARGDSVVYPHPIVPHAGADTKAV